MNGTVIKPRKKNPRVIDWYECRGCLYAPGDGRKNGCKTCGNFLNKT